MAIKEGLKNQILLRAKDLVESEIRPMIQSDGGDIEVVNLTDDFILQLRLSGACVNCASSAMTLAFGVEERIKENIPEITGVAQVS